jgi:hypothetical protein
LRSRRVGDANRCVVEDSTHRFYRSASRWVILLAMPNYRRFLVPVATVFFTVLTYNRRAGASWSMRWLAGACGRNFIPCGHGTRSICPKVAGHGRIGGSAVVSLRFHHSRPGCNPAKPKSANKTTSVQELSLCSRARREGHEGAPQRPGLRTAAGEGKRGRGKGTSLNSASLAPKPVASSVYVRALEAPCPHRRSISVTSLFPSAGRDIGPSRSFHG